MLMFKSLTQIITPIMLSQYKTGNLDVARIFSQKRKDPNRNLGYIETVAKLYLCKHLFKDVLFSSYFEKNLKRLPEETLVLDFGFNSGW